MEVAIYVTLRVIHVACAATWFGVTLTSVGGVKRALDRGVPEAREATRIASRAGKIAGIMGLLTLVTGVAIIFDMGGFGQVTANFHAALGLIIIMLVLSFFVLKPTADKLQTLVEMPDFSTPNDAARSLLKRLNMFGGIMQLLWTIILVLMFWRWM